jgi:DNA-binding MarR family transcriptional regulator
MERSATAGRASGAGPASAPDRPFRAVGFLLSQLGFQTSKRFAERLAPLDLNPRTFALLRHIEAAEGQSQHALAEALRLPPSRMVALLDELEERNLVERRPHPTDRRVRALHLAPAGKRLLGKAKKVAAEHEAEVCADLTAEEREQLLDLLGRIAAGQDLKAGVHPALGLKFSGPPGD